MWHAHSIICHCYLIPQMAWWLSVGEVEAVTPHSPARLPCVPKCPRSSDVALDQWFLHAHLCCRWRSGESAFSFASSWRRPRLGRGSNLTAEGPSFRSQQCGLAGQEKKNWILDGFPLGRIHGCISALETLVMAQFREWKIFLAPTAD